MNFVIPTPILKSDKIAFQIIFSTLSNISLTTGFLKIFVSNKKKSDNNTIPFLNMKVSKISKIEEQKKKTNKK